MKEIVADGELVAHCGLYCGACRAYRKGKCPGCVENAEATWCKVRACCQERDYGTCAECAEFADPKACRKFHNLFSRIIGFLLRSDRGKCIARIRAVGPEAFAREMAERRAQTLRP